MSHPYHRARFLTSAHTLAQLPPDEGGEVALAGRSNAGKSSVINAITGLSKLARTSKTPGCTQQINFFSLGQARRLVDLPGFGYAQVPAHLTRHWQHLLTGYLEGRRSLKGVMLVMDARRPLTPYDLQMLDWCSHRGLPVHLLLNKADKLSYGSGRHALQQLQDRIQDRRVTAQLFSARLRQGIEEASAVLDAWLVNGGEKRSPG